MEQPLPVPDRALVIMAHPDDPEFAAGGTIARWTAKGSHISYVIVSDGSKGSDDESMSASELVEIREEEQEKAAKILGVNEVRFLGFPDGAIFDNLELRRALVSAIRSVRPDLIITHDPTARLLDDTRINHPDHLAVGETALNAVFPFARDRLTFPELLTEGLQPHKVLDVYLAMSASTNVYVDISDTFERKLEALLVHQSQIGEPKAFVERMRRRYSEFAEGTGHKYVERFRRIKLTR